METCYVSARFPATSLRFRSVPRKFFLRRSPASRLLPYFACNLHSKSDKESSEASNRMFILGMGFVGQFFAEQLKKDGWEVSGTCTTAMKKKNLEEMGYDAYIFDANDLELKILNSLEYATHLVISIPPVVGVGDLVLRHRDLLKRRVTNGKLRWLCYLSSTSVYGDCDGAWVNEDYPANPTRESAKARLDAEKGWLNLGHDLGLLVQVFRLGGIYGPGRSAVDTIIKQEPLSEGQRMRESRHYTSRVHVADICQALNASIDMPSPRKIYNIVDDDPAPRGEVFAFAQGLVEKRWPSQFRERPYPDRADLVIQKKITGGEKRVSNARLKKELGVRLLHPSYKSGLQSIVDNMANPS
ncbi:hypothetical protein HHK36_008564 [Tetracentron sinense]|uniref:NAD-dependent epimerase/dehydratase domain-containing protein n=1 Tax=Tetracentron sinense TaxID=13715 RepID=A0A834ZMU0_TETSI|nr:hypothetical protein HHK36_008564 [Tetracentron sinense]